MLCVYVATHKQIAYPYPSYCKKVQMNVDNTSPWVGYVHDNTMDNISSKNPYYCELTALYHLWKNSKSEYKGLYHYRRTFGMTDSNGMKLYYPKSYPFSKLQQKTIGENDIIKILKKNDIILPVPNNPFPAIAIEALSKFVSNENIQLMISTIEENYPEYAPILWDVLTDDQICYCNIFIALGDVFNAYCEWVFKILSEIDGKLKKDSEGNPPKRIYGYLSEILLNVYVRKNNLKIQYLDLITFFDSIDKRIEKLIYIKKELIDKSLCFGINPSIFNRPFRRICNCKSKLLQGQKLKFKRCSNPITSIILFYRIIGASGVQRKKAFGIEYVLAKMDYKTANECFVSVYYDGMRNMNINLQELVEVFSQINRIEKSDEYTLINRVFIEKISEDDKRKLLLEAITPIAMETTFY